MNSHGSGECCRGALVVTAEYGVCSWVKMDGPICEKTLSALQSYVGRPAAYVEAALNETLGDPDWEVGAQA